MPAAKGALRSVKEERSTPKKTSTSSRSRGKELDVSFWRKSIAQTSRRRSIRTPSKTRIISPTTQTFAKRRATRSEVRADYLRRRLRRQKCRRICDAIPETSFQMSENFREAFTEELRVAAAVASASIHFRRRSRFRERRVPTPIFRRSLSTSTTRTSLRRRVITLQRLHAITPSRRRPVNRRFRLHCLAAIVGKCRKLI